MQQSVCLIDDDAADVWRLELAPLDQFHDAAWRAHHYVRLGFELFDLSIGRRATDQQHRADRAPCILREVAGLTMDLDGQLVRWRNDHDLGRCLRRIDTRKEGQQIRQRLAGARLRVQIRVLPGHQHWHRRALNGRRITDLLFRQGGDEIGRQQQIGKRHEIGLATSRPQHARLRIRPRCWTGGDSSSSAPVARGGGIIPPPSFTCFPYRMCFPNWDCPSELLQAISEANYVAPTPIQAAAIPAILRSRDVPACAQTGSGKTAVFALPMLQRLLGQTAVSNRQVVGLILVPTRELAIHYATRPEITRYCA